MGRRATLHDVADRAGVSIKTVSRVVNGSTSVSEAVRERVNVAVESLQYVPNSFARSLKAGTADTIGVVMDTIADPFFAALTSAVEAHALKAGLNVIFGSTGFDPVRERSLVERMAMQRVRALILAPVTGAHEYLAAFSGSFPIVMIDRPVSVPGYDTVGVDDRGLTREAVEHLIAHGHRRIAFVGSDDRFPTTKHRVQGYRDAMRTIGAEPHPSWVEEGRAEEEDAAMCTFHLLRSADVPTAIFAANPRAGLGVAHALHTMDRADIAFISFGDFPLSTTLRPAITYVNQDPVGIGIAAMERVLARLADNDEPAQDVIVRTNLVARGSGEIEVPR